MNSKTCLLSFSLLTAIVGVSPFALASRQEVEDALALVRLMQPDKCESQKIRGKILFAHQSHNQSVLDDLAPQLDAITQRLKPNEDKLRTLTAAIKQTPEDQAAFSVAQVQAGGCH